MKLFVSILLVMAIILQPLSKFMIVSNYALHTKSITEKYCVNKAKPKLKCNGKCHLKKQLIQYDKQSQSDSNKQDNENAFQFYTSVPQKGWMPLKYGKIELAICFIGNETKPYSFSLDKPPTS